MRINRFDTYRVRMPLKEAWQTAAADENSVETIIVRAEADGHVAWIESAPHAAPLYAPEWGAGVFVLLRDWLMPKVIGKEIGDPHQLAELLMPYKGNPYAKGTIDIAWWLLQSKAKGIPLYKAIGGTRDSVEVGDSFGVASSLDKLVQDVQGAVDQGVSWVKLKFCRGWEIEMLHAVRGAFPKLLLTVDCNAAYSISDKALLKQIDQFHLSHVEQPFAADDLAGHIELAKYIQTPIALDESVSSFNFVKDAIRFGACQWVHMKIARVGGITAAIEIHDYCQARKVPCVVSSALESALGAEISLAVATLSNFEFPASVFNSSRHYFQDLATPPMELKKNDEGVLRATVSDVPGILRQPNMNLLDKWCLEKATISTDKS